MYNLSFRFGPLLGLRAERFRFCGFELTAKLSNPFAGRSMDPITYNSKYLRVQGRVSLRVPLSMTDPRSLLNSTPGTPSRLHQTCLRSPYWTACSKPHIQPQQNLPQRQPLVCNPYRHPIYKKHMKPWKKAPKTPCNIISKPKEPW